MNEEMPLLQKLRKENALPFVDFVLTDYLLNNFNSSIHAAPLLLHLSQSARAGHLCIKVNDTEVLPKPQEVWEVNDHIKLSQEDWRELEQLIQAGVKSLSSSLAANISHENETPPSNHPLCRMGSLFYFQKYWAFETTCLQKLFSLLQVKPSLKLDPSILQSSLDQLLSQKNILPEQAHAIHQLEKQALILIAGGPGTGKTYTAGLLIKVFWNALPKSQREKCRIALAAPTGKAAANLQKSLSKAVQNEPDFPAITAVTIHSLLGLRNNRQTSPSQVSADLLIIDECSMIDIRMMSLLLHALKPGARLIMLGDPFQLPPVEAGAFFSDMLHLCPQSQVIELHKCLRTDLLEIVHLAKEIKQGASQAALHLLKTSQNALHFIPLPAEQNVSQIQRELWEKAWPYLSSGLESHTRETLTHFCILSPLRKGPLGVDQLNHFFYKEALKKARHKDHIVIPIMIIANDSKKGLFNGDMGFLIRQRDKDADGRCQIGDYAVFSGKKVPALLLPPYEYAYCLSVHKSQGSEFDHVLLLMPEGSEHFGRELIYTAVTRARTRLEIWSTPSIFEKAIHRSTSRLSRRCGK